MISNQQSGNVLFFLLIAVALFAALSYVVTQSSRVGAGSISNEKANLLAAGLINNMVTFEQGVQRMLLTGG